MATFLRPGVRLLTDLRARSGTLVDFVPDDDIVSCETTDAVDLTGTGTLVVDARSRVAAQLTALKVIELVDWSSGGVASATEEWRITSRRLGGGGAVGAIELTLVPPLVYDWTCPGQLRTQPTGGLPSYDLSGDYTPAQALALITTNLAAHGQSYWTAGTIDRTDVKHLTIQHQTPLELLHTILETWALEAEITRVSASSWTLGLRNKRGGSAAVPTVRATGALASVQWTQDATPLANAVAPLGANGVGLAHAAWKVTAIASGVLSLVDPAGGPPPIQIDGQLVGAYVLKTNNTLTAITATAVNDRVTSLVTVASTTGISVGDEIELRADSSGTRLVVLQDDAAITGGALRREVALDRSDLDDVQNYVPNPRGATHGGTPDLPTGWTLGDHTISGPPPSMTRITTPAGCPIGDDGTGQVWEWTGSSNFYPNSHYLRLPATMTFDASSGDATFFASVWIAATAAFSGVTARLVHTSTAPINGTALATTTVTNLPSTWTRIDVPVSGAYVLGAADDLVLELIPATGFTIQAAIAAGQIARGTAFSVYAEHPRGNLLHQAANAWLVTHRVPTDAFDAVMEDLARLASDRWGDLPIVTGGDVVFVDPTIGLNLRVRVLSVTRNRLVPTPPKLALAAAPDPTYAALVGKAAPSRVFDLLDVLQQVQTVALAAAA